MHISTVYRGTRITGVVVKQSRSFIEVAITSPYSKLSSRRHLPRVDQRYRCYRGAELEKKSQELLIELYQVASAAKRLG